MRTMLAITLVAGGCTIGWKEYVTDGLLPNGDEPVTVFSEPAHAHGVLLSVSGLDVTVWDGGEKIADWFSLYPLPPFIPLPNHSWDEPGQVHVWLTFRPHRGGWSLSPGRSSLRVGRAPEMPASIWRGRYREGARLEFPKQSAEETMALDGPTDIVMEFAASSPLMETAELQLDGVVLEGHAVRFPAIGLRPRYRMSYDSIP